MKKRILFSITTLLIFTMLLSACNFPFSLPLGGNVGAETEEEKVTEPAAEETDVPTTEVVTAEATEEVTETPEATEEATDPEESPTPEETQEPQAGTYGPDNFPEGINPLTGLPNDPELLDLPPAMVSVSNFPASARPQYGLNTSPVVFEITIGEGMTRFLALFYGGFPQQVSGLTEGQTGDSDSGSDSGGGDSSSGGSDGGTTGASSASIGPIRSGRLPYEDIRSIFSGFLVMASAYSGVAANLNDTTTIYGSDSNDVNSARIDVGQLYNIALERSQTYPGNSFNLEGNKFSPTPPEGGMTADEAWLFYSNLNQIQWRYDEERGAYIRYDIKTDGSGEFVMSTDQLDGEPITRENVIVLFAMHEYYAPTLIDIYLDNMPPMKALLFRDGEVHEIFWTTQYGDYEKETGLLRPIRFVDEDGNPVALKNGQTWVEIVSTSSFYVESEISENPFFPIKEAEGTGLWLVRYKGKY
ncbi:DUF3048 C-terminal domain-containing protein [bacterium]|nr:DUF3048 C-terminal domain-containing protein [bacterium]